MGIRTGPCGKAHYKLIPIVFAAQMDPVGAGVVASLARPGGNVTGMSIQQTDTASKRLELLREVVPNLGRLAIMANVAAPFEFQKVQAALEVEEGKSRNSEQLLHQFGETQRCAKAWRA